jgi:uncharacterized membrane protein
MNWFAILRWLHIGSGAAWLGEVVAVNFVLVPALLKANREQQRWMLAQVFPRVFNLASWLAGPAVVFGALLNLQMTDWRFDWDRLTTTRWGWSILVGGTLGLVLTLFHFVIESKLEPVVRDDETPDEIIDGVLRHLRVIPRYGLGVLVIIFGSMMYAARGF